MNFPACQILLLTSLCRPDTIGRHNLSQRQRWLYQADSSYAALENTICSNLLRFCSNAETPGNLNPSHSYFALQNLCCCPLSQASGRAKLTIRRTRDSFHSHHCPSSKNQLKHVPRYQTPSSSPSVQSQRFQPSLFFRWTSQRLAPNQKSHRRRKQRGRWWKKLKRSRFLVPSQQRRNRHQTPNRRESWRRRARRSATDWLKPNSRAGFLHFNVLNIKRCDEFCQSLCLCCLVPHSPPLLDHWCWAFRLTQTFSLETQCQSVNVCMFLIFYLFLFLYFAAQNCFYIFWST